VKEHVEALTETGLDFGGRKPLAILVQGYPSKDLIKFLQDKDIKFVMRMAKGFNSRTGGMETGSKDIPLGEGIRVRTAVFPLDNGEREALITNLGEDEAKEAAFPSSVLQEMAYRNEVQPGETEAGTGELQRVACGEYQAGCLRDNDGSEHAGRRTEGSEQKDRKEGAAEGA
jgi:hypothetical protein